ncbi:hypothetical protein [Flexivirga sp.]|uniref:hypothetical protein n=1 Tax=Flexivirga sp. TaxID=1962927 RepID=UPI003F808E5F
MLIWINGAFGAGKTQTAHELRRRLPEAQVADPMSVDEVVEWIAADAGLRLAAGRLGPVPARLRRLAVSARHIRW